MWLNIMFWSVLVLMVSMLYVLGFLKALLKTAVVSITICFVLTITNLVVLIPIVYILPFASPVCVITCMIYATVTILNSIDAFL